MTLNFLFICPHTGMKTLTHSVIMVLKSFVVGGPSLAPWKCWECAPNAALPPSIRLALPSFVQRDPSRPLVLCYSMYAWRARPRINWFYIPGKQFISIMNSSSQKVRLILKDDHDNKRDFGPRLASRRRKEILFCVDVEINCVPLIYLHSLLFPTHNQGK